MNESIANTDLISRSVSSQKTVYEFARAASIEGWWWWALLLLSLSALFYGFIKFYRKDSAELARPTAHALILLRAITIVSLIFFFFDFQRRTQREITRPSEVVVLVDTSQSMSLAENDNIGADSRQQRAAEILGRSSLLNQFGSDHRLSVYAFGDASEPLLLESRGEDQSSDAPTTDEGSVVETDVDEGTSGLAMFGALLVVIAAVLSALSLAIGSVAAIGQRTTDARKPSVSKQADRIGWILLSAAVLLAIGIAISGSVYSVNSSQSFASLLGLASPQSEQETESDEADDDRSQESIRVLDWDDAIAASASQSRIGDAISSILATHDPTTLAGIVLLSDGQNNGGSGVPSAMAVARRTEVAVYPVGLGSSSPPVNVRVVDLDAPRRVYPNDRFAISAVLQATGGEELEITLQLLDGLDTDGGNSGDLPTEVIDSQTIKIPGDGSLSGAKFELEPESVGRRRLAVRVVPPAKDQNDQDNVRDARYEVVARKLRVLTIAGGPTREYRFVRNLLHREKSIRLDTWLQTGQPGMSQDADKLLTEFPQTAAELFEYDAIAMFDPDWTALSAESLELMDRWLASQAGGLVIVGGPVYHPRWLRMRTDPRVARIAGFFPVTFSSRGLLLGSGREGGQSAWPLDFTPEARRTEFLWVTDDPQTSFDAWESFGGVYDYVGVKGAKPVAKVYAHFSDPTTQIGDTLPVYLASQYYGAGKVYFQGSGEMWRMRRESDAYFDNYYTKLIRWACEGRLLRDSNRGVLLVDKPRAMVGDTITVRAVLTDAQFEPLNVPEVKAKLLAPGGRIVDVRLTPIEGELRPGTYSGRFVVREAGNHELRLTIGDALDEQLFRQNVQVRLPTIELERPRRNDEQLQDLASATGGTYFKVEPSLQNDQLTQSLVETIRPQPQTTVLPGTPDPLFNERRNASLLWLIACMLTMEWVIRRLHRLA